MNNNNYLAITFTFCFMGCVSRFSITTILQFHLSIHISLNMLRSYTYKIQNNNKSRIERNFDLYILVYLNHICCTTPLLLRGLLSSKNSVLSLKDNNGCVFYLTNWLLIAFEWNINRGKYNGFFLDSLVIFSFYITSLTIH